MSRIMAALRHPRTLVVAALAIVPVGAFLLLGASQPTIDEPQITAAVRAAIHEYRAGAAVSDVAAAKGGMAPASVASIRAAAVSRLNDVATGAALTVLTTNLDAVLATESTGTSDVITGHAIDQFIVDLITTTPTAAQVKGREHGFVDFKNPGTGAGSRSQSWEYFDASLMNNGGRWLVSNLRVIPTLSDDPKGVPPYPANGDPAE